MTNSDGVTWQQDGASIHRNADFLDVMDHIFEGRVLALGADRPPLRGREWPPRSPDLNPLDFSIWGILKDRVYRPKPNSVDELKEKISREVQNLNREMLLRCSRNVHKRAHLYVQYQGGLFEHNM